MNNNAVQEQKMNKLTFNSERCKSCGLCAGVCPKKLLAPDTTKLNSKGYHPYYITDQEKCSACAMCAMMCPDCVIKVEKDV